VLWLKKFPSRVRIVSDGSYQVWPRNRIGHFRQPVSRLNSTRRSTRNGVLFYRMIVTAEIGTGQLADLIKQVQAGAEVLLTQGNKPVAKLVPAFEEADIPRAALHIRSLKGHRVLTPVISQAELAEEMFGRP
jgi:antitoxin (DNA-binding transcriptional repressor) of toxin-antitoxin stability system